MGMHNAVALIYSHVLFIVFHKAFTSISFQWIFPEGINKYVFTYNNFTFGIVVSGTLDLFQVKALLLLEALLLFLLIFVKYKKTLILPDEGSLAYV